MNPYPWRVEYRQKLSLSWKKCHFGNTHQLFILSTVEITSAKCWVYKHKVHQYLDYFLLMRNKNILRNRE